jgi:SAM-dependent methyltransferase
LPSQRVQEGFPDVDRAADPGFWVGYLDRLAAERLAGRERSYDLLGVRAGDRVLDAGCGTGEAARELAALVGSGGRVVGVDRSETMIREARRRVRGLGLPIAFRLGDVRRLRFADDSFDGCRAERVLIHLNDPGRVLAELRRVTRPGGRVVIAEPDVESRIVDAPDRALTRRILNQYCDSFRDGWMGRRLPRLFHEAGLEEVTVNPWTYIGSRFSLAEPDGASLALQRAAALAQAAGAATAAEVDGWLGQLAEAGRAGGFFTAITVFIVSGRKP